MSEPTKATIDGRVFAVLDSRETTPDVWWITVDDLASWIPVRANAVLHFPDRDRAGLATWQSEAVIKPDGFKRVTLTVTVGLP